MRSLPPALFVLAALVATPRQEGGVEPELRYRIEVDGCSYPIRIDEPVVVSVGEGCATLVLRREGTRLFRYEGLRFAYPDWMAFQAEVDPAGFERWVLTGKDATLTIERHLDARRSARTLLEQRTDALRARTGGEVRWEHLELAGERRSGRSVRAFESGWTVQRRVFTLSHGEDVTVLVLAENLDEDGRSLPETRELLRVLTETLRLD